MPPRDTAYALVTAIIWGLTFIAIRIGVEDAPPLALSALRFTFAALPAILFIQPPRASPMLTALYGLLIGVGQFGVLFIAIERGMPIGLVSLVIQLQAFVTVALAYFWFGERLSRAALGGGALALIGLCVIGYARYAGAALGPFLLTLVAACCWGLANIVGKRVGKIDMLAFTVWSSLAAPAPLFLLSAIFEGDRLIPAITQPTLRLALCVAALSVGGTLIGYGLWSRLLAVHPAAKVAPFALLVPVVGMVSAYFIFGERFSAVEGFGGLLIMAGLVVNVFGESVIARSAATRQSRGA